jgi:hypothetical protein
MLTSPAYSETLVPVQPVTLEDRPYSRCWSIACFSTGGLSSNVSCSSALQRITPTLTSQRSSSHQAFDKVATAAPPATGDGSFQ